MLAQSAALVCRAPADGTRDPGAGWFGGIRGPELKAWPTGLDRPLRSARGFYATIAAVTLLGMVLNYAAVSPIKALFRSAVINGLSAGPIMILIMLMASDRKLTGKLRLPKLQWIVGWMSTLAMLAVAVGMLVTTLHG